MTLRLNRLDLLKEQAERQVDERYAQLMAEFFGPVGMLHLVKRYQALAGVAPDGEEILSRVSEQDQALTQLDEARRAEKAKIRACQDYDQLIRAGYSISGT